MPEDESERRWWMYLIPAVLLGVPGWTELSLGLNSPLEHTSAPVDLDHFVPGLLMLLGSAAFIIVAAAVYDSRQNR